MVRPRVMSIIGALLLVAACATPCLPLTTFAAIGLPYQDPTPELLEQQAADEAAAWRSVVLSLLVSAVVASVGVVLIFAAVRKRRSIHAGQHDQ